MENSEISIADIVTNEEDKKILEPVKTSKKKKTILGVVNCGQLFLREEADIESDALYVLTKGDAVVIDEEGSTPDFYKVVANGVVGFCVKEFITVK